MRIFRRALAIKNKRREQLLFRSPDAGSERSAAARAAGPPPPPPPPPSRHLFHASTASAAAVKNGSVVGLAIHSKHGPQPRRGARCAHALAAYYVGHYDRGRIHLCRFMVAPALASLPPVDGAAVSNRVVDLFRPILYTSLAAVLISGLYNYLTKPFYPPHYHAVIGVKFLFVLHVFAASVLYTIPNSNDAKRTQRLNWLVISGLVIVAISAYLRWMTLNAGALK